MLKRFKKKLIPFLTIVFLVSAVGFLIADQSKVVMVGGGQAYKALDDFLLEGEVIGGVAGNSWYVDSGKTASGDGKSWDYAVITIDEAINLASTASNGDVIHIAPGHAETIDAATDIVCDTAGITFVGYGSGSDRPTLSWADAAAATIAVSGANNVFKNIIFDGSSTANDGPTAMFTITAAGFELIDCRVVFADTTEAATAVITGSAAADNMRIWHTQFIGTSAEVGANSVLEFSGAADEIEVGYCYIMGDFAEAAIDTVQIITNVNFHHNYIWNTNNGNHAIQLDGNATGTIAYNQLVTDVFATALDPGKCDVFETYWADDGADDVLATPVLTHEDGNVLWSATERAVLESECNDALVDENLDHFVKVAAGGSTTAYPSDVTAYSILGYIMAIDGAVTDFDEGTDSLEAISDKITTGTDTLSGIQLDHFVYATAGGSTTAYPSDVTAYSQLGYILGIDGDPTGYDEATDSLEALGDQVTDVNLELMANNALVDEGLDHMITAASGGTATAYPENVTASSVIAYMMAIDGAITDYDEATDSLEAISDKITTGTDSLSGIQLDHFVYATAGGSTTAYPSDVTNYSILGYIMGQDGDVTGYDEDTDSLEALGTQVADTNLELQANDALVDEGLDHMITVASGGSATAYPENVTQYSVLGYVLGQDGDATGYDEDTDSLEALGNQLLGIDHFITATAGGSTTAYPSDVTAYSILGYIMGVDADPTGFDEDTDSLEALGTDTDAIIVDTQDIQNMVARCATRTTDTLPQTATETIFDVSTGPVRVLELVGEVTTVIGATVTNLKISIDPTTGAASDMASNLAITNDLDGSFMTLTGAFGSILVNTAAGGADGMSVPYIVPIGIITITTDASVTGSIAWFIRYEPLAPGATVAANGP